MSVASFILCFNFNVFELFVLCPSEFVKNMYICLYSRYHCTHENNFLEVKLFRGALVGIQGSFHSGSSGYRTVHSKLCG